MCFGIRSAEIEASAAYVSSVAESTEKAHLTVKTENPDAIR